jgi:diaminohydroxyphosphoribosylaminopyrimidine deaminase/5-amino-6-(5-phosphoribosylamino)uracil reductase
VDQFSNVDQRWMRAALELAARGQGAVEPNPMVGCVLVKDGTAIASGYHAYFGGPHAEVAALDVCESPAGSTAYVTLEPCCHRGKTPPCVDALINAKVERVVIAMLDPFGKVNGQGAQQLRESGMAVDLGVLESEARELNRPYLKRIETGIPWIIAKWAMSLDGKIATATGASKWISSEQSRTIVHEIRGRMDAIMIGSNTALADDPLLTARPAGPRTATRIVLDSRARLPLTSKLVTTLEQAPVLLAVGPRADATHCNALRDAGCEVWRGSTTDRAEALVQLLKHLGSRGMTNVLVEGGSHVLGCLNDTRLIDEIHCFVAPILIGGQHALSAIGGGGSENVSAQLRLEGLRVNRVGDDIHVCGRTIR